MDELQDTIKFRGSAQSNAASNEVTQGPPKFARAFVAVLLTGIVVTSACLVGESSMPLEMPILCDCGKSTVVSEVAVGCKETCCCGKALSVPALTEFRLHHGLPAVKPNYREWISSKIQSGTLPGNDCQGCGVGTDQTIAFVFDTEFKLNEQARQNRMLGGAVLGNRAMVIADFWARESDTGNDFDVPVVLSLCEPCRRAIMMNRIVTIWAAMKLLLLVAGLACFFFEPMIALAVWGAAVFFWATEDSVRSRRIRKIRELMNQIPEYHSLLIENPRGQPVI